MSWNPLPVVSLQAHLLRDSSLILLKPITAIKWEAEIVINWLEKKFKLANPVLS